MNESSFEINGAIDSYGWQRSNVKYQLGRFKGKSVRCKVNSMGGSVNDALAISKLFEEHGDVTVEFVGFCASAVTWMAFGAKSIEMHEDSLWLCHKCSIFIDLFGQANSTKIDDLIKQLQNEKKNTEVIDLIVAKKYVDRCAAKGKSLQDVQELMNKERWLTVDECLEWGFVDKKIPGINKVTEEVRNQVAMNCAELNLPTPVFPRLTNSNEESLVNRIIEGVKGLFNAAPAKSDETATPTTTTTNQSVSHMNKTFTFINLVLAVDALTVQDGKVFLDEAQLTAINEALQQADAHKKAVNEATQALDGISDHVKSIEGLTNKVNALKAVINLIPSAVPANQTPPAKTSDSKEDQYKESKVDPVNNYFNEI